MEESRNVDVGLYVSPPFVTANNGDYSGMAIDLWERIADSLGLATRYETYPTFRALVEAAQRGEIDAAVTNLTITRDRAELISFTQPWYDGGLRILVSEEGPGGFRSVAFGLLDAGHLHVYAGLLLVIVVATLALTVFDRRFDPEFPGQWREGLAESLYHVVSLGTSGRTSRKNLFGWKGRVWSAVWMACGIAVIAYITSSVTSVMTTVSLERGIHSLAGLSDRTVAVFEGSTSEDYMTEMGIATRSYPDIDASVNALKHGRVDAVVGDAPILEYYAYEHPEQNVTVVGALFHPDKYGFAFPRQSKLVRPVTLELLKLLEDGAVEEIRLDYFGS